MFWNTFKTTPLVLGLFLVVNGLTTQQANANEEIVPASGNIDTMLQNITNYNDIKPMSQITSVSQLRDVSPTDWAYEALRSLVERYGCIVGYPDRTYRGNRALNRFEFAAGLNSCMQQMERLIAQSEAVLKEDIEMLKRLMKEFEVELASLGARVDNLEARVGFLEDHQFSTTTKLKGEVIMAFTALGDSDVKEDQRYRNLTNDSKTPEDDTQATLSYRVRLSLDTSFTGKDLLKTRLSAGNIPDLSRATGTDMARLSFAQNTENSIEIDKLFYRTPLGDKSTLWIATDLAPEDVYDTMNPFLQSSANGSLARFNRYNPFIYRTTEGAGLAFKHDFSDMFDITASYFAGDANDPGNEDNRSVGLFNGIFSAGIQLGFYPTENVALSVAYMHNYFPEGQVNLTGSTGSNFSSSVSSLISNSYLDSNGNRQGGFRGAKDPFSGASTVTDNVGIQGTWRITENINWAAWGGWSGATGKSYDSTGINRDGDYTDLWTWNTNFSFLDVFKEGAVLTIAGGQLPRAGSVEGTFGRDRTQAWIVEGQYNYPVNDNITITPGVYAIFNANNHIDGDSNIIVGVLRTVFKF
jgi:hypothetical protein